LKISRCYKNRLILNSGKNFQKSGNFREFSAKNRENREKFSKIGKFSGIFCQKSGKSGKIFGKFSGIFCQKSGKNFKIGKLIGGFDEKLSQLTVN
jgi:hypothetical protein